MSDWQFMDEPRNCGCPRTSGSDERREIVRFLRSQSYPVNVRLCADLADAISRGEHLKR
jgi:hypothetical protein